MRASRRADTSRRRHVVISRTFIDQPVKLEYIADGAIDTPLIRLYDFGTKEAVELHRLVCDLSAGRQEQVALDGARGIEAVDGCRLVLRVGTRNEGVVRQGDGFVCTLTASTWRDVAELVQPFCERADRNTFQYLDDTSEITLILSVDGGW